MKKVSKRLYNVSDFINKNSVIIDVGTDHGLLPKYLIETKKIKYAVASDIVPSICEKLKNEFSKEKLDNIIKVLCMDGLKDVEKKLKQIKFDKKIDTIVITGMGGLLICEILKGAKQYIKDKTLVLSPHRDSQEVRRQLHKLGFKIIKENVVEDKDNKFYVIIKAKYGREKEYSEIEYKIGKKIINSKNNNDAKKYISYEIKKMKNKIAKMKNSKKIENELSEQMLLLNQYISVSKKIK